MITPMLLRRERSEDQVAIHAIHTAAFAPPAHPGPEPAGPVVEATLVDELRDDGDVIPGLSIVAELDGRLAGHVVCSNGFVGETLCPGLGPLGVHPDLQRGGVGLALMHAVLGAADALGYPAVVLLGDPAYYSRFGFVLAGTVGIEPPMAEWAPHFQVRPLTAWNPAIRGKFRYAPAFDRL